MALFDKQICQSHGPALSQNHQHDEIFVCFGSWVTNNIERWLELRSNFKFVCYLQFVFQVTNKQTKSTIFNGLLTLLSL